MFKKFMSHAWFSPRGSPGGLFQIRDMFTRHDITTSKNKYFLFLYCPSSSEWSDVSKNVIKNGFTQQQHVQNLCVTCMIFFFFPGGFRGKKRGPPDISKIFPRKSRGLAPAPQKHEGHVRYSKKQHGLIRFSFARKLFCSDLEVNRAPTDREIRLWKTYM